MERKELYIIGAGGFGREVAWLIERINEHEQIWDLKGFIDDNESLHGRLCGSYPIFGGSSYLLETKDEIWCVCAIGNSKTRKQVIERLKDVSHIRFATAIDPKADISKRISIGEGSIICAGNIITVDVCIGNHNIINLDCTIGHDAVLDDFVTLYPSVNISGQVKVGKCTEIGTGANIIQGKKIGKRTVIGAGAVVINDIADDCTAVGSPAREIKHHIDFGGVKTELEFSFIRKYQTKSMYALRFGDAA